MMNLYWTPLTLAFSALAIVAAIVICVRAWNRSGRSGAMAWLELLRFSFITLAVFTLNQPEIVTLFQPKVRPTVAVLVDDSASMDTADVHPTGDPTDCIRRTEAAKQFVQHAAWDAVKRDVDLVVEHFSSKLNDPREGTDLNSAMSQLIEQQADLRAVVLVSDGDWNTGDAPRVAATRLRLNDVPVFAAVAGSDERLPDLRLTSFDVPTFAIAGKPLRIPYTIDSSLPRDLELMVELKADDRPVEQRKVRVAGMGRTQETVEWRPTETGEFQLSLTIPSEPDEYSKDNDSQTVPITVRHESLRVLIVESYPRWEYRYLRNALERDPGVTVNCLLLHPKLPKPGGGRGYLAEFPKEQDLFKFDVVVVGDMGVGEKQLTVQQCHQLKQLVSSHAGGLIFLPGFHGKQQSLVDSPLDDLLPVIVDREQPDGLGSERPAQFQLTDVGRKSLLTRLEPDNEQNVQVWRGLPGFHWYAAVLRAKVGSEVLATHQTATTRFGRVPLIVTRGFGTGKVLFMGTDGAWRWRRGVEDRYHYRFWGQVVRWMAYQRTMSNGESIRLFFSPDRPVSGDVLTLNANVMTPSGEPLQEGRVVVQVSSPSGATESVTLQPAGEESWGLFTGSIVPEEGGTYEMVTSCVETEAKLVTEVAIEGLKREQRGEPARYDVMEEIAKISRGELLAINDVETIVDKVRSLPQPEPTIQRLRIWSHPLWGALLMLLLTLFWITRKLVGLV